MKILIIDDDDETCRVIETFLKQKGHTTAATSEGKSGLKKIMNEQFDSVVLDLSMPEMSGMDLISELSKTNLIEKSNIVIYSAVPFSDDQQKYFISRGIRDFISKKNGLVKLEKSLTSP